MTEQSIVAIAVALIGAIGAVVGAIFGARAKARSETPAAQAAHVSMRQNGGEDAARSMERMQYVFAICIYLSGAWISWFAATIMLIYGEIGWWVFVLPVAGCAMFVNVYQYLRAFQNSN